MTPLQTILTRPVDFTDGPPSRAWFDRIAEQLLTTTRLRVGEQSHRLIEIEIYYHGPGHEDPFAHRDPVQLELGRWYFHRTGGAYRSGSFKGLDLAFGDGTAFGGVLFRGLETERAELIDGPSLLVDFLLEQSGAKTVRELDTRIDRQVAWDARNALQLQVTLREPQIVYTSSRVGLTLKKAKPGGTEPKFLMRAYRYFTEPRGTKKGKPHIVLGLHRAGVSPDDIRTLTGCPKASIERYLSDSLAGQGDTISTYFGKELDTTSICRLTGLLTTAGS
jgi:hypothetical protein